MSIQAAKPGSLQVAAQLHALLRAQRQSILNFAARRIPNDLRRLIEPQDVLQDTFLEAFRRLAEFEPADTDAARRWLLTIARTKIINFVQGQRTLKRGGRYRDILAGLTAEDLPDILAQLAVYERTPSESALAHELAIAVEECLQQASPDDQAVIRQKFIAQLPIAEIASRMGRSEGAVQMLCQRALERLRASLSRRM